jgi:hypothetical protein
MYAQDVLYGQQWTLPCPVESVELCVRRGCHCQECGTIPVEARYLAEIGPKSRKIGAKFEKNLKFWSFSGCSGGVGDSRP